MKLIDMTCSHCGAHLKVDADKKEATCEFCGAKLLIDDEVQHIQYDNAEEAGYNFEKGRQRAIAEANKEKKEQTVIVKVQKPHKRRTWLWILGWLVIFPVPLTILLLRNEKMDKKLKYGLIACAWVVYFIIGVSGAGKTKEDTTTVNNDVQEVETVSEDNTEETIEKAPFVNNEKLNDYFLYVDSNQSLDTDTFESVAKDYGLTFDCVYIGWGGFNHNYHVYDENNPNDYVGIYCKNLKESDYVDILTDYCLHYEGLSGNQFSLSFYTDESNDEKRGYYVNDKQFSNVNEAMDYYFSLAE